MNKLVAYCRLVTGSRFGVFFLQILTFVAIVAVVFRLAPVSIAVGVSHCVLLVNVRFMDFEYFTKVDELWRL